jgi:hypothetical protein
MAESTPVFTTDPSTGPNDAAYIARAEAAAQQAAQANEPAGDFGDAAASASQPPAAPEPPAPLAGKFKDAQELEKAYLELQKKLGSSEKPEAEPGESAEKLIGTEALDSFVSEFRTSGALSEESYGKLQNFGLSKQVVDAYIEGQKALADRQAEAVYAQVGGRDSYQQVIEWASSSLSADEQEAFNGIMASGDMKAAAFAVKNLAVRFAAEGGQPVRIEGKAVATPAGFRSKSEMVSAMRDPRYQRDPAYRQEVARKMASSQFVSD